MTAEHDGHDAREAGQDALLAAITGDPLSGHARTDPAFLAAHRTATADVAVLREQLALIADALTGPEPAPDPAPAPVRVPVPASARPSGTRPTRPRPRRLTLAFRAVAVAAAGVMVVGLGWLVVRGGSGPGAGSAASDSAAGADDKAAEASAGARLENPDYLACARLVVEGDVTDVEPVPGTTQRRVMLRVTRSYKPDKIPADVRFLLEREVGQDPHAGEHVLVVVPQHSAYADAWITGSDAVARERNGVLRALSGSRALQCR